MMPELTPRWLKSFDGTRLHYTVEGEGERAIILADGIGCDGWIWRYMRPILAPYGRIIHMHMRGHGNSEAPRDPAAIRIKDCADDLRCLMDAEQVSRAVVMGHSMGVQVSLELWHRDRERVEGLGLLCGSFEDPVSTFRDHKALKRILRPLQSLTQLGGGRLRRLWQKGLQLPAAYYVTTMTEIDGDLVKRHDVEPYLEHLARMDPPLFFRMLGEAGAHSARAWLGEIDVPVLIIAGEQDQFTPAYLSEQMAQRIAGSTFDLVSNGAHACPIEHPTRVNLTVRRFMKTHFEPT
jgi:pimeloyl-ACP methyl ester carboxylesterase